MIIEKTLGVTIIFVLVYSIISLERLKEFLFLKEREGITYYNILTKLPFLGYSLIIFCALIEFFSIKRAINIYICIIGFFLILFGVFMRKKSIRDLGTYWSKYIKIFTDQKIVESGSYKIMRHPYIFSVISELFGFCLFLNSYFTVFLVFLVQFPILVVRGIFEEKILQKFFWEKYLIYKKKTPFI